MMTLDEFDAPRLPKAPRHHAICMLSGATIQYLIYANSHHGEEWPYYIALVNNRDNTIVTSFGAKDYAHALRRITNLCLENIGAQNTTRL